MCWAPISGHPVSQTLVAQGRACSPFLQGTKFGAITTVTEKCTIVQFSKVEISYFLMITKIIYAHYYKEFD